MLAGSNHQIIKILPLLFIVGHKLRKAMISILTTESQVEMLLVG
jgi:hypothetical protein